MTTDRTIKKDLRDLSLDDLLDLTDEMGEKPYRARQLYKWLFSVGVGSIDEMTDISKKFRAALKGRGYGLKSLTIKETKVSKDGSIKMLLETPTTPPVLIESVLIPSDDSRLTLCVSTQAGCSLGCEFCMTARGGAGRNLTLSEMVGELYAAREVIAANLGEVYPEGARVTNVVLMGMGEPLLNYDEVLKFLDVLVDTAAFGLSQRKVTVSTAGITPMIKRLGQDSDVNLAVSLNAATDALRTKLMPVNKKYPLKELIEELRAYPLKKQRMITIEYILIEGVNDSLDEAAKLLTLLRGIDVKINLIPFNPFKGTKLKRPSEDVIADFRDTLTAGGIRAVVRASKGLDVFAACGQLSSNAS